MYLVDTSIISLYDPRRVAAHMEVVDWMRRNDESLFLSSVTFTEIELGILKLIRLGSPTRAGELEGFRDDIIAIFRDRSLPLTVPVALEVARLAEAIRPMVIERTDLIIAATAKVHRLTVLTRNLRHFSPTGVACLDPLLTLPPG
jgi:hypothetical protein